MQIMCNPANPVNSLYLPVPEPRLHKIYMIIRINMTFRATPLRDFALQTHD